MADLDNCRANLAKLEERTSSADLWDNPQQAQKLMQEMNDQRAHLQETKALESMLEDADAAAELASLEVVLLTRLE